MKRTRRLLLLPAAATLLMACPATLEDDFKAVDGTTGGAGSEQPGAGAGGGAQAGAPAAGDDGYPGGVAMTTGGATSGGQLVAGATTATGGMGETGGTTETTGGAAVGGVDGTGSTGGTTGGGGAQSGGSGGSGGGGATGGGGLATGGAVSGGNAGATGGASGAAGRTSGAESGGTSGDGGAAGGASGAESGGTSSGEGGDGGAEASGGALCASSPASCETLRGALVHRYRFEGTGTTVTDSVAGANGTVKGGATLSGDGELSLVGGTAYQPDYVDLPNGIVSALTDATFETWIVWNGGQPWQRVFDFGDAMYLNCVYGGTSAPEGQPGACGRTYLYLIASTDADEGSVIRTAYMKQPGEHPDDRQALEGPRAPTQAVLHLAVVVDDAQDRIQLFVDGAPQGAMTFYDHLSDLRDINNWLGRSQFADDATNGFDGTYLEFRIYGAALSADELETSYLEGPDPAFLE